MVLVKKYWLAISGALSAIMATFAATLMTVSTGYSVGNTEILITRPPERGISNILPTLGQFLDISDGLDTAVRTLLAVFWFSQPQRPLESLSTLFTGPFDGERLRS
jgi:hypothetical protein